MARITVEDCEKIVTNRFELVVLAAQRTRQILGGDKITLDSNDEKKPIIALREIAAQTVSVDALLENAIKGFRNFTPDEDLSEDIDELPEEDAYNPYAEIEMADIESSNVRIIGDEEAENMIDDNEEVQE
jgi:DNA-directed RNA polymerase subunit omega